MNYHRVQSPYKLDCGEGLRYAFGSHLATIIAGPDQLGQAASGTILTGAKGAAFPMHKHGSLHEAFFVVDGVTSLALDGRTYLLTPGDYVNIPPGTPHSYTFLDHRGKLLAWSFGGSAAALYSRLGKPYAGTVYPECTEAINWTQLDSSVDTELLEELIRSKSSSPPSSQHRQTRWCRSFWRRVKESA